MTPNQLKTSVIQNKCPNVLLFTGDEVYVKNFYLNKIAPKWTFKESYKNVNSGTKSLFSENYIIDGSSLSGVKDSELQALKDRLLVTVQNKYVFLFSSADKVPKNVETIFSNFIVNFTHLNETHLLSHFQYSEMSINDLKELFEYCDYDYTKIKLEIDKVLAYTKENNVTPTVAYTVLKNEGIIIQPIGDIIFNLTNAVVAGNITQTNYWLEKIKQTDELFLTIVSALYNNFRNLYLVKATEKDKKERANIGIESNRIWGISKNIKIFSEEELKRNLCILEAVQEKIVTGLLKETSALNFLILNLLA